jgi:hypothetical protein
MPDLNLDANVATGRCLPNHLRMRRPAFGLSPRTVTVTGWHVTVHVRPLEGCLSRLARRGEPGKERGYDLRGYDLQFRRDTVYLLKLGEIRVLRYSGFPQY